jgi:hypothetical protein
MPNSPGNDKDDGLTAKHRATNSKNNDDPATKADANQPLIAELFELLKQLGKWAQKALLSIAPKPRPARSKNNDGPAPQPGAIQPPTAKPPPTKLEKWAQQAPLSIAPKFWWRIWLISLLLGTIIYSALVWWSFNSIQASLLNSSPTEVEFLTGLQACPAPEDSPTAAGKFYGAAFGATDDKVLLQLNRALCATQNQRLLNQIPAISLVDGLISQGRQCGGDHCSVECSKYWQRRIARLLGGSLRSGEDELKEAPLPPSRGADDKVGTGAAPSPTAPDKGGKGAAASQTAQTDGSCDIYEPSFLWDLFGLIRKPSPVSAPDVAKWLLGTQKCVGDDRDLCVLTTRLLQSSLDNPNVRTSRTFVNMIWGGERLAVLTLCFVMALSIFYRYFVRRNLDKQKRETLAYITKDNSEEFKTVKVRIWFEGEFPEADDNEDFTPIRNLLKVSTINEIDLRARIDSELISQSRVPLDTLITVFPVIGFVATLWGLIVALSSANLIASSIGDERNANVMRVTSELSSCFSTTLLALVAMTLFAVLNILQAKRELALVSDVQDWFLSLLGGTPPALLKPSRRGRSS